MSQVKTILSRLKLALKGVHETAVVIYGSPDPDALASAWAIKELFNTFGVPSTIGYTGIVGRPENEAMIQELKIPATRILEKDLESIEFVVLVDCQPDFFQEFKLPRCDFVVDHHPQKSNPNCLADIRPKSLATSSIVTEYLRHQNIPISRRVATALLYGIKTDSRGILRGPTPADKETQQFLESRANHNQLRRIEFSRYSLKVLDLFDKALQNRTYAHHVLYSHIGCIPGTDVCAQVADFLIRVKEAHWAVVTGSTKENLIVVFRCDGHQKNAGKLASLAFGELGSAGGHKTMGRAEISLERLKELEPSKKGFERFVVEELSKYDNRFRPLLKKINKK